MISAIECRVRARDARIAGFKLLSGRDRLIEAREVGDNEYPLWVRDLDRQAGNRLAEADRWDRLAEGSFLVRLFWRAER